MTDIRRSIRKRVIHLRQRLVARRTPRRRVIFFHIPKCAGISVTEHFRLCTGSLLSLREDEDHADFDLRVEQARSAPFVAGHFGWDVLEHIRGDALVFTVLRDPLARLRSQYCFHRQRDRDGHPPVMHGRSFGQYLASPAEVDNVIARQLAASVRYERTAHLEAAPLQALAIAHLARFDHIGFMATLSADLATMCRLAGCYAPRHAPWLNRSPTEPIEVGELAQARPLISVDRAVYAQACEWAGRTRAPAARAGTAAAPACLPTNA